VASALLLVLALSSTPTPPVPPAAPTVEGPVAPKGGATAVGGPTATPTPTPTSTSTSTGKGTAATEAPVASPRPPLKAEAEAPKVTPRTLSGAALADELRDASRRRQQELSAIRAEREKLEKLREEIEASRKALREETARLDERIKAAQEAPPPPAKGSPPGVAPGPGGKEGKLPVDALAKTLKGMRPEQAAGVVARLEKPLAVELLRHMRPGDAAALLDRMKPEAAADLFVLLAGGRR
jgi:flagellar motility protein MotE (MotC chaperone)